MPALHILIFVKFTIILQISYCYINDITYKILGLNKNAYAKGNTTAFMI